MTSKSPILERPDKYLLLDASVVVGYYLKQAAKTQKCCDLARNLIEPVRDGLSNFFLYIPNFCIAEVFSTFMKHSYGRWNRHVKKTTIDERVHKALRKQFQSDIHNARLFYHLELSRYHILGINLVAPIDHLYQMGRPKRTKRPPSPSSTFDQLIISMGIYLTKIHGNKSVFIITTDKRLEALVEKCRSKISASVLKKIGLSNVKDITGIAFEQAIFPSVINLEKYSLKKLKSILGELPALKKKKRGYLK